MIAAMLRAFLAEVSTVDGILMCRRLSIGWNFHRTRQVKTFGLAISFSDDRCLVTVGPITLLWLIGDDPAKVGVDEIGVMFLRYLNRCEDDHNGDKARFMMEVCGRRWQEVQRRAREQR